MKSDKKDFFEQYGPRARAILEELVEKYADHGSTQFTLPEVLEVPPLNRYGNVIEIARLFGGERLTVGTDNPQPDMPRCGVRRPKHRDDRDRGQEDGRDRGHAYAPGSCHARKG